MVYSIFLLFSGTGSYSYFYTYNVFEVLLYKKNTIKNIWILAVCLICYTNVAKQIVKCHVHHRAPERMRMSYVIARTIVVLWGLEVYWRLINGSKYSNFFHREIVRNRGIVLSHWEMEIGPRPSAPSKNATLSVFHNFISL